ncbi:TrlF family AAA-like ATPase [Tsukamurella pseudospumae]|uniref:TrlF family AAA-like ATPase n=1 Tax=Tsukamurella pseudospumae TaxID=239498 RepID=UPI0009E70CF4|nr:chromosome segregation protein SMC [Tsukamurella pseudospumae]
MASLNANQARGTSWRIWDLHVHTPASLVQGYGGDTDKAWAKFLDDLESLPPDIGVIGINDYWFLDGYKRIVAERDNGRLGNLDAIFPVVELRLDQFGGTDSRLSRVNMHVIFDPDLDAATIEAQFINALQPKVKLSPEHRLLDWSGVITRESLADLGHKIKHSVPDSEKRKYGTDLEEGFNNLNASLDDVLSALDTPFFKGKSMLGVGRAEWADIKWNGQSIAAKKNVINQASLIFTAFEDASRWKRDVDSLRASNVNYRLLDCSDAHHFSDSNQYMRLGACQTWMNTVPTFAGLVYALEEFDRRVYVGLEPSAISRVRTKPEQFMAKVRVTSNSDDHSLFDYETPLNSGFVAVVGNKGQGKSALLDCIALAGNSSRSSEFAFLNRSRFLSPASLKRAREYRSEVEWETGGVRGVQLSDDYDRSAPVMIEYLPQAFVERVCNVDDIAGEEDEFERELRAVLFTHIPESDRAGEKSFDDLLAQKARVSEENIERLRLALRSLARSYSELSSFRAAHQLQEVEGRLALKEREVDDAKEALAIERGLFEQVDSASSADGQLVELRHRSDELQRARSELLAQRAENQRNQADAQHSLSEMDLVFQRASILLADTVELNARAAELMSGSNTPLVVATVNTGHYDSWRLSVEAELLAMRKRSELIESELEVQDALRQSNSEELASMDSARERARRRVNQCEERVATLVGEQGDGDSLEGIKHLRNRVAQAPDEIDRIRGKLIENAGLIHRELRAQLGAVEGLYAPASKFIAESEVVRNAGLEFNAELRVLPTWRDVSIGLDGRRNGDYSDWLAELPARIEDTSWGQIGPQLEESIDRLEHERGDLKESTRNPATALRSNTSVEDFLFDILDLSWLEVRFGLTGEGLPLSQLSPGQRGLVLALFYLVVDRRTTPLLLDQPEENLDNETIASKLVPAIHEAVGRRQTIVVTHNANLAVVGDADQIVHCQMVDNCFTISSGSIAELDVAQFALDVLEGTKPAFDNRRHKYEAFPELRT